MANLGSPLTVHAGPVALAHLRDHGLRLDDVDVLVGAAGGTKFLMLGGLDRVLFPAMHARKRHRPLHCVGSSIGAWRLACLACKDPVAALERLAEGYIEEKRYTTEGPRPRYFCDVANDLLRGMLAREPHENVANHPFVRLHVLTSRCGGLAASEHPALLLTGLGLAAAGNLLSRRTLGWQMTRTVFHSAGEHGPLDELDDLPTVHATLTTENLERALLASAAIPLLIRGVSVPGDPHGVHRDAGIVDYHPVLRFGPEANLVLYPHFYDRLTPGWFDRSLPFRRARMHPLDRALDRTVVLAPSERFVSGLPGGKRPSRRDARRLSDAERRRRWRSVWRIGQELGDALGELLESPRRVAEEARPLVA